jgi:hypothetical protein
MNHSLPDKDVARARARARLDRQRGIWDDTPPLEPEVSPTPLSLSPDRAGSPVMEVQSCFLRLRGIGTEQIGTIWNLPQFLSKIGTHLGSADLVGVSCL